MFLRKILFVILTLFLYLEPISVQAFPQFIKRANEKGITQWYEMPFGQMRLMSCTSGVKDLPLVVGGLQIELKENWVLKKPVLKGITDDYPVQIGYPVYFKSEATNSYKNKVFFPITYARLPSETKDFLFGVQGTLNVCKQDDCLDLPFEMRLPLSSDESNYTTLCSYILANQYQIPLDARHADISGIAYQDEQGIHLQVKGLKKVQIAFLQTETPNSFRVAETQINENDVQFLLTQTTPWENGTTKDWLVLTNRGIYRVPFIMQSSKFKNLPNKPDWDFWFIGFEWFLISPLLIWWGLGTSKTTKLLKKHIKYLIFGLLFVYSLTLLMHQLGWDDFSVWFYVGVLGIACFFPLMSWWQALLLFCIWPRPFLNEIDFNTLSLCSLSGWIVVTFLEMISPLILLYLNADKYRKILKAEKKKKKFRFAWSFFIPTFGLLAWNIYAGVKLEFSNDFVPKGWVVVCDAWDNNCLEWKGFKQQNVQVFSKRSLVGKILKEKYHRPHKTLVILYDELGHFVLPPDTSVRKGRYFIKDVKRYHASDTP